MEIEPIYCAEQVSSTGKTDRCCGLSQRCKRGKRAAGGGTTRAPASCCRCCCCHALSSRLPLLPLPSSPHGPALYHTHALLSHAPIKIVVPAGLDQVLKEFTKEAIRHRPPDLVQFAAE